MISLLSLRFLKKFTLNLIIGFSGLILLSGLPTTINGNFFQKGPNPVKATHTRQLIIQPISQTSDMAYYPNYYDSQPQYLQTVSWSNNRNTGGTASNSYYASYRSDMGYDYGSWTHPKADLGYNYSNWAYPRADMGYNYGSWASPRADMGYNYNAWPR